MQLDLVEINKLSPRELWQLAPIRAFIETLLAVIKSENSSHSAALYMRILKGQSDSLREKIRENLNMRIKAWIMQCPERILWVRNIIGETAIRHWHKNRLADYALRKYFGDWKRKWPNGFKSGESKSDGFANKPCQKKHIRKSNLKHTIRDYGWKPFALVKIFNVRQFLYGHSSANAVTSNKPNWTQPRAARTHKPIRFTPYELTQEATTGREENDVPKDTEHLSDESILLTDQRGLPPPSNLPLESKPP